MGKKVHQLVEKMGKVDSMQVRCLTTLYAKLCVSNNRRFAVCAVGWCHGLSVVREGFARCNANVTFYGEL